ncbi:NAD(P)H-dependent oxidoreductase [Halovivax gelatinilyticus]|uniref:NAD(P)H-dependent oxidoreductase n=1 Tax=Halovivax gelatinilyticus TaxID=2961597 RepID=UPI0020CA541B|nr:NAD(P)H-dependent oxidoreductase [Halovivax gelatinilyticus]
MRVLIVIGHPRSDSLCGSLASSYREGASEAGVEVETLALAELDFDPHVRTECPSEQVLETDLAAAADLIRWADHIAFVYPNWWGTMPALLKGFFDRVFRPGFAFEFYEPDEGAGHRELLADTTAELLVTMDVPPRVYRCIQREPGTNAIENATLGFAGIRTTRRTYFGSVETSTADERATWLDRAERLGRRLETGPESRTSRVTQTAATAIGALRLQFYPMAWIAYAVGALAATGSTATFTSVLFWLGFGFVFFLEAATVLSNEYVDVDTDRRNTFAGPFTGGSRVLVDGDLEFRTVGAGAVTGAAIAAAFGLAILALGAGSPVSTTILLLGLAVLALGYTLPPFKLSYRTLGELDVATTHSLGVLLCGYVVLGGNLQDPLPWVLGLALFLSIVPSITLAGVPDRDADRAAGKKTIAVRYGFDGAAVVAVAAAILAAVTVLAWALFDIVAVYVPLLPLVVVHAGGIAWLVHDRVWNSAHPGRIDTVMIAALSYILWFGLLALYAVS